MAADTANPRFHRRKAQVAVLGALIVALLLPQAASAAQDHAFFATFGSPGSGSGQLSLQPTATQEPVSAGSGLAVSSQTGDIYVADSKNHRIDEFTSAGAFVRAFGWEVEASAPEAKLQVCTTLTGCQAGSSGTAPGQLGNPTFLAVDNDPTSPSYGDLYAATGVGVEGSDESQKLTVENATGGTFTLTFEGETTEPIPYNASRRELELALQKLPAIGFGNLFVGSPLPEAPILFFHRFEDTNVPQLTANIVGLEGTGAQVQISTRSDGAPAAPEIIAKYGPAGELIESWGEAGRLSATPTLATGTGHLATGSAIGTGTLTSGSTTVTGVNTESGAFQVGQGIEGEGMAADDYITAVGAGTLTLAKPAVGTGNRTLTTNTRFVTNLNTESGAFASNQTIGGAGIPAGTEIEEVGSGFLALRRPTTAGGSVELSARRRFRGVQGIAGDGTGRLSVSASGPRLFRFDQSGAFGGEAQLSGEVSGGLLAGLAIDSQGDLYSAASFGRLAKLDPTGNLLGYLVPNGTKPTSLALAPTSDDLYVDAGGASIMGLSHQCEPLKSNVALCVPTQEFGSAQLSEAAGLAVAPDGTLYAANTATGQIARFTVSLEANTEAATEVKGRSAVLHGTIDPKAGEVVICRFQHGTSKEYGENLPCLNGADEEVGTETDPITEPTDVHAPLEGLQGGTTYHYRLRARNAASPAEEIHSEDEEVETLVLPKIEEAEATEVTASSANLKAKIDPQGPAVTSCQIEWGATSEPSNPAVPYEETVPCEPSSLPAGTEAKPVATHLEGLDSGTTYHWRVTAADENGTQASPDHTFVFLPGPPAAEVDQECENEALREANGSTALPDCRAYEQVTPPAKNGSGIYRRNLSNFSYPFAEDGSRLFYSTLQCYGGARSCNPDRVSFGTAYELSRSGTGWGATPLTPSAEQFAGVTTALVSPDTGDVLFRLPVPEPPAVEGREWFYAQRPTGSLEAIGPVAPVAGFSAIFGVQRATADLSRIVYPPSKANGYWPFDPTSAGATLYEYAGPAPHPLLVAVSGGYENGENHNLIGTCGAELAAPTAAPLSADGRTVYFKVNKCAGGSGVNAGVEVPAPTLYARIDGESETARTVKISAPAPEPACDAVCQAQPPAPTQLAGASADGRMAYFLSTQQLNNEASEERGGTSCLTYGGTGCNLYLYQDPQEAPLTGDHLIDVSAGDTSGRGPQVQGVMAMSRDGRRVYFVARGLLAGENAEGKEPTEGAENLYFYDASEARTRFIATLPNPPVLNQTDNGAEVSESQLEWENGISGANLTPDGRYLLFTSHGGLTPDTTRAVGPEQVFRYDAQSERLNRISIGQRGFNDNGNAGILASPNDTNASIAGATGGSYPFNLAGPPDFNASLSADGHRAFFESPVGLTPGALDDVSINNRGQYAENIYEWEEEGAGGCKQTAGCVYLLSDGRDTSESRVGGASGVELIGADAAGETAFFTTADALTPSDVDTAFDIYAARVGGGFASPPQAVPCETSEACHPGGSGEGGGQASGSSGFNGPEEGPGHPRKTKGCPKGRVRHHGRCVKPHKHRHAKKHTNTGGK